jgi:sugar phosphate isomerase/epimerase
MRWAFSTNAFKKNTLDEAIASIAAAGYRGVELMADIPHAYPPSMNASDRQSLKRRIASLGLQVSNINAFTLFAAGDTYHPTWIKSDPDRRGLRISHTLRCLELAREMGSHTISLQPGGPMIGAKISRRDAEELFADGLRQIIPGAREAGIILAVEPEPGLLIQTAEEYRQFKKKYFADEPLVRMNCDIGHLFCVGDDPATVIRQMPQEIAHIHLEDIGKDRVHQHLAPGKGVIDFAEIVTALRKIDYRGWVTVELYPYEVSAAAVAKSAWEFLRPIAEMASTPRGA